MSERRAQMNRQGISVVLGTYNRKSFLKATVDSIRADIGTAGLPHASRRCRSDGSASRAIAWQ